MFVTVYNTTSAPITVDPEGRQIGGNDWGTVNTTQELVKPYLAPNGDGSLVQVEVPTSNAHPDAVAAAERTEAVSARSESLQAVGKDVLAAAAKDAGVPDAEDLSKPDLVHALANRPDVEIPEPAADEEPEDDDDTTAEAAPAPPAERKSRR
jgi:hypothetical protein